MISLISNSTDHLVGQASPLTSTVYEIPISHGADLEAGEAIGNIIG
jgi:hypothetical protein